MTLVIGSYSVPGQDLIQIVKLVDYMTFVARPNAALLNWRRQLTTGEARPTRTPEIGFSMPVR
jgi:hypothetical protein